MKQLTRRSFTAAGIIFAASLATGCFAADDNVPVTVYGPPAEADGPAGAADATETMDAVKTEDAKDGVGGTETSKPSSPAAGKDTDGAAASASAGAAATDAATEGSGEAAGSDSYDAADNIAVTVYGPPDDYPDEYYGEPVAYDPSANEVQDVYGPPSDFDVWSNVPEDVYGPPIEEEPWT